MTQPLQQCHRELTSEPMERLDWTAQICLRVCSLFLPLTGLKAVPYKEWTLAEGFGPRPKWAPVFAATGAQHTPDSPTSFLSRQATSVALGSEQASG